MSEFRVKIRHLDALARSVKWSPFSEAGRYSAKAYIDAGGSVEIAIMDTKTDRKAFTVCLDGFDWLDMRISCHDANNLQCIVEANVNIMRQLEGAINLMMEMGND